jgi:uncharacterized repeat protein (TIGR01451 family)
MSRIVFILMVAGLLAAVGCEQQKYDWSTNEWKPTDSEETPKAGQQENPMPIANGSTPIQHVCTILSVDKSAPASIINGKEFSYTIRVTNTSRRVLSDVRVREILPANYTLRGTDSPDVKIIKDARTLLWMVKSLPVGGTALLEITGTARATGRTTGRTFDTITTATCKPNPSEWVIPIVDSSPPPTTQPAKITTQPVKNTTQPVKKHPSEVLALDAL